MMPFTIRGTFLPTIVLVALIAPSPVPAQRRVNIPVTDEIEGTPVVIVHHSGTQIDMMRDREELGRISRRVIVAAWEDGTVVWSRDRIGGGEPYFTADVGRERVADVIAKMCESAEALPEGSHTTRFGPDSAHNSITVHSDACRFNWQTWHEVYESRGRLVSVDGALTVLPEGRTAQDVRRERSSEEYLLFIDTWTEAKAIALSLVPDDPAAGAPTTMTFRTNWVTTAAAKADISDEPTTDRDRIAAEAVERLTAQSANIYTNEWSELPEPEFTMQLVTAIDAGRFADHDWLSARAREMALRRMSRYPEIVYPVLVSALADASSPHDLGRAVLNLPPDLQALAHEDIRALIERDAFTAQKEEFLYAGFFGRADKFEAFWMELAKERFGDPKAPTSARIAAGAAWYSMQNPDATLAEVREADGDSREPAVGALSRMIAQTMTNTVLGSEENLRSARPLVRDALKSEEGEVRQWAARAIGHVALGFGDREPDRESPDGGKGAVGPEMVDALRQALKAETDWRVHATMERALQQMEGRFGGE